MSIRHIAAAIIGLIVLASSPVSAHERAHRHYCHTHHHFHEHFHCRGHFENPATTPGPDANDPPKCPVTSQLCHIGGYDET
jgi:hypothetical protein